MNSWYVVHPRLDLRGDLKSLTKSCYTGSARCIRGRVQGGYAAFEALKCDSLAVVTGLVARC
jgi:hypothetical protein